MKKAKYQLAPTTYSSCCGMKVDNDKKICPKCKENV